jgi:GNAT superfamily N-acetyltransferase
MLLSFASLAFSAAGHDIGIPSPVCTARRCCTGDVPVTRVCELELVWCRGQGRAAQRTSHRTSSVRSPDRSLKGAKIGVVSPGREDWEDRRHGLLLPLSRCAIVAAASMLRRTHVDAIDIIDPAIAAELLELQRAAYRIEAGLIGSSEIPPLRESLDELLGCGETFLGAYLGGNLVGGVSWKLDGDTLDIHRLVDPEHFRRGIGTTLIRAALAANPNAARAVVQTGAANKPAAALYLREGFALVGTEEPIAGLRVTQFAKVLRGRRLESR